MVSQILAFIFGLLIAMLIQGIYLPWLQYRKARARLLQVILVNRKAWIEENPPGDWWIDFRNTANTAAEELLQSRLTMIIQTRRLSTFLKITEEVKYITRKSADGPEGRQRTKERLEAVLKKLNIHDRSLYLEKSSKQDLM